jgi:hypothetical protein
MKHLALEALYGRVGKKKALVLLYGSLDSVCRYFSSLTEEERAEFSSKIFNEYHKLAVSL